MGGQLLPIYCIRTPERGANGRFATEYHREVDYDRYELEIQVEELQNSLTNNQHQVYNTYLEMVEQNNNTNSDNIMFLDLQAGPARLI